MLLQFNKENLKFVILNTLDWAIIVFFLLFSIVIGIAVSRRSGKSSTEFFLSGRNMPWWLLGISMVATTFSADTPNLVTNIVRENGVAGNWVWWAFLLTGMLTVFVYARLWRRSGVVTDLEFYELRYSGDKAAFLRGLRAIYLGVFFNVMILATVMLAAIKIGEVMLGLSPVQTILAASIVTVVYSALGGLRGVIITDFFLFILAMVGSVAAAIYLINIPEVGGITSLLENASVAPKLSLLPDFNNPELLISLFIIPIAVQWWSVWYPGAEPGGGGYIAQRMLAAKDENNAVAATLLFNVAHYALRPWPWILIGLCSLVVFPELSDIQKAFPHISESKLGHDLGYPAMLTYLPHGLLGVVIASLLAAFMSTLSTQLNWGSSYLVNDVYKRFVDDAADEKTLVRVGRLCTIGLMILAALFALLLTDALQGFNILLQIGAGTGLIFILRWFWWRINAWSEIAAMLISFLIALFLEFVYPTMGLPELAGHWQLILGVVLTTIGWLVVTFMTRPTDDETLLSFYRLVKPDKKGWKPVIDKGVQRGLLNDSDITYGKLPVQILSMLLGCLAVYAALFATGYFIYGQLTFALIATVISVLSTLFLISQWKKI